MATTFAGVQNTAPTTPGTGNIAGFTGVRTDAVTPKTAAELDAEDAARAAQVADTRKKGAALGLSTVATNPGGVLGNTGQTLDHYYNQTAQGQSEAAQAAAAPAAESTPFAGVQGTGATPVPTPIPTGTPGPTGTPTSTVTPIPTATPTPTAATASTAAQTVVDPTKTTQGLMNSLLTEDSDYLKRARALSMEKMNERGLSSSSMAQGAGVAAAIDAALGIATPDAQIYNNTNLSNTAAKNQFGLQEQGQVNDLAKMDKQQTGDLTQLNASAANAQKLAGMNIDATKALNISNQDFATFTNKSAQAASIVRDLQAQLTAIDQNPNFTDAAAKTTMKDNYVKTARLALAVVTNASQDADLQAFMDQVFGG